MSNHEPRWARLVIWIVFAFAIWGFISMIGCAVNMAHADTRQAQNPECVDATGEDNSSQWGDIPEI
jgi:hypothetical protein